MNPIVPNDKLLLARSVIKLDSPGSRGETLLDQAAAEPDASCGLVDFHPRFPQERQGRLVLHKDAVFFQKKKSLIVDFPDKELIERKDVGMKTA
jgi:hypothetical protein